MQFQYGTTAKHQLILREFVGIAGDQQVSVKHQLEFNEGRKLDNNFNLHVDESRVLIAFSVSGGGLYFGRSVVQRLVKVLSTETFDLLHTIDIGLLHKVQIDSWSWYSNGIFMTTNNNNSFKYVFYYSL